MLICYRGFLDFSQRKEFCRETVLVEVYTTRQSERSEKGLEWPVPKDGSTMGSILWILRNFLGISVRERVYSWGKVRLFYSQIMVGQVFLLSISPWNPPEKPIEGRQNHNVMNYTDTESFDGSDSFLLHLGGKISWHLNLGYFSTVCQQSWGHSTTKRCSGHHMPKTLVSGCGCFRSGGMFVSVHMCI